MIIEKGLQIRKVFLIVEMGYGRRMFLLLERLISERY